MVCIYETCTCTFADRRHSLTAAFVLASALDVSLVMGWIRSMVARIGSGSVLDGG